MSKSWRLFSIVLFFLLLCAVIGVFFFLDQQPVETNPRQEAKMFLDNVVGINTEKYEIDDTGYVFPNEVALDLISDQTRLRATILFNNNKFVSLNINANNSLILKQSGGVLDMASDVMKRYQSYTGDAFYGELQSMLNDVTGENITSTKGNVQLDVFRHTNSLGYDKTWITWTYIDDDGIVVSSKHVALGYSKGYPEYFADYWQSYEIIGVPTISSMEAVDTALNAFKNYSGDIYVGDFVFVPASDCKIVSTDEPIFAYYNYYGDQFARDGKTYSLYPAWFIPITFENTKTGKIFDDRIIIWADTGEIGSIGYKGSIY